jgi:uroporphyrinogen III methyltransferase/synthase
VKGRLALSQAGVVLYDHLANEALLELAPAGAERIYVGKKKSVHAFTQAEICSMLIERARRGLCVVRLKGGDPYIFGRGGEEAEALADAGVAFEVIPGVTAALGLAAYCGVPLTHREHTSSVTYVTGHDVAAIEWAKAASSETVVVYMGLHHAADIAREMISHGRAPETPAIAVRWATRPEQETVRGTLGTLAALIEAHGLKPPATIVIGEVAALSPKLGWYQRLPLFGRSIAITRAPGQAADLARKLRALGANAVELPAIAICPASDYGPLDLAIERIDTYDWVIFTSANGVRFFLQRLDASARDLRDIKARLCAIGPATRDAIETLHLKVDVIPDEYVAESLVARLSAFDLKGKRVLLPRAAVARDVIPLELSRRGAHVDVVEAYRTVAPENLGVLAAHLLCGSHKPDWITFTSSSTVKNFVAAVGRELLDGVRIASIGPVTSATARAQGLEIAAEAEEYTSDGLVRAIVGAQARV